MRIINRRAYYLYYILEKFEAGIALLGNEVKSLRGGRVELSDAYVKIIGGELFLINANIPRLVQTSQKNYDPIRSRKLLMHKEQINSLIGKASRSGVNLVPLSIYDKHNRFKLEIGLGKTKREYDKRRAIKEKDHQRRLEQELREKE